MNMGTFEAMDQMEMMEVNGGARRRSARRAAQRAARRNFSAREVVRTAGYLAAPAGIVAGIVGTAALTTATAPILSGAAIGVGLNLVDICFK